MLLLDRWPGERGPAWDTGEPIPWPSAAEQRARAQGIEPAAKQEAEPEPSGSAVATATHPRSKKRKRKQRH